VGITAMPTFPRKPLNKTFHYFILPHNQGKMTSRIEKADDSGIEIYRVFRAQANWTLTHTSHKNTELSIMKASITLDGVTMTDPLIR
jgi:hypothetical protein